MLYEPANDPQEGLENIMDDEITEFVRDKINTDQSGGHTQAI